MSLLSATMLTAVSTAAQAQEVAPAADVAPPEAQDAGGQTVGDIVVTARKTAENLQKVPLTITAFSSKALEKTDTKTIFDLATRTPGVYFGTTGGRNGGNKLQIRNFSTGTSGGSKASVFIDGVYMAGDYSSTPLANLERAEVLKGPQSAQFGRSTFVGAINFVTKDPGNNFEGKIDAIAATLGEYDVTGYISTPIIEDKLANSFAFRGFSFRGPDAWTNRDGYHFGNQSTVAATNKLVFRPSSTVKISWYNSYIRDRDHIPQTTYAQLNQRNDVIRRPDGTFSYYFKGAVNLDHSKANASNLYRQYINGFIDDAGVTRNQYRSVLDVEAEVFGQTLSGYAALGEEKLQNRLDGFYLGADANYIAPNAQNVPTSYRFNSSNSYSTIRTKDRQLELRLTSPSDWRLRYAAGYNFTKLYGSARTLFDPVTINAAGQAVKVNAAPVLTASTSNWIGGNPATVNSIFGALYFDLTDQLTVSAEVRHQWENIRSDNFLTGRSAKASFTSTLPRFNVQFKATDDLQFYVIYSKGNNPGGFNLAIPAASLPAGVPEAYGEESLDNYEAGMKSVWLGGKLLFNLAVYHMDWNNQQVAQSYLTALPPPNNLIALTTATARSKVTGVEAELEVIPTEGLNLRGTFSYGKAKYVDYCSSNYFALTGVATALGCRAVNGFQQEGTPAMQISLFADYTKRVSDNWEVYTRADYQYQSKVFLEEWNASWINPAHIAGARIGAQSDKFTVELFVRNLLDDDHSARITRATFQPVGGPYPRVVTPFDAPGSGGTPAGAAGNQSFADTARRPRQFGVRFGYKF